MKNAFLITIIAGIVVAPGRAQDTAATPSADVPELAALSRLIGKWDSQFEAKRIEGVTEGETRKGTAEAGWILGGRFLRQTWAVEGAGAEPGMSGSSIMTYDPAKKAYRSWHFVSTGSTSEGEGTYDKATRTITWTARDANGFRTRTRSSFAEDGSENWTITVTDTEGRIVTDMKGKNTRRKP
ncbi:MAG: Planctomycetes uncharacterized domain protein [Planctomycetota bacterium]|nr:Planctomycetes uncharacterized domain protein [Planctomycetota bacterium]